MTADTNTWNREDDTKWPQKNKDGRQELEIRMGSEHISFEVRISIVYLNRFERSCTDGTIDGKNRIASGCE
jgi:hypothetical protein